MAFNYEAALRAGYSPEDIIGHLTKTRKFNVEGALNAGYSPFDIIEDRKSTRLNSSHT